MKIYFKNLIIAISWVLGSLTHAYSIQFMENKLVIIVNILLILLHCQVALKILKAEREGAPEQLPGRIDWPLFASVMLYWELSNSSLYKKSALTISTLLFGIYISYALILLRTPITSYGVGIIPISLSVLYLKQWNIDI